MGKDYSQYFIKPNLKEAAKRSRTSAPIIRESIIVPEDLKEYSLGKKYLIRTFGCQANERDEETIAGILELCGYIKASCLEDADLILLNTCAVRENAEERVFGEIGNLKRLKAKNPELLFGICGCMVQEEAMVEQILSKHRQVDIIFGTHNIINIPSILLNAYSRKARVVEVYSKEGEVYENLPSVRNDKIKAWVNIMYGCDKFCTYCIVPYTRGKERSRLMEDILEEVRGLKDDGYQEITLLGQNVNAYGKDLNANYDFAELLIEVAKIGIPRIRFTTSHPWDFNSRMIDAIRDYDNIMPFVHLPLQSGDTEILRRMGRRYTYEEYKALYNEIRTKVPNVSISTDIIVGFPQESLEQFENTLKAADELAYDSAFTFIYSPRIGTPAARMQDDVSLEEKHARFNRLVEVIAKHAIERNKPYEGQILKVLVEGTSKKNDEILSGYSEQNKLVNFKGNKGNIGKIVKVKILKAKSWTLEGEEVNE